MRYNSNTFELAFCYTIKAKIYMKFELENDRNLEERIRQSSNPDQALSYQRFYKTGPGQYAEGIIFLGIPRPQLRAILKDYQGADDTIVLDLITNPYHEVCLLGVLIIIDRYERAKSEAERKKHLNFYLKHRYALNNWDLVDISVPKIWGDYLLKNTVARKKLFIYASSKNIWERRMSIVATLTLIKAGQFKEIFKLLSFLKHDSEDLIQKALGWMLREVGKKDEAALKDFLDQEAVSLARTTLRYAIERFSKIDRQHYLKLSDCSH